MARLTRVGLIWSQEQELPLDLRMGGGARGLGPFSAASPGRKRGLGGKWNLWSSNWHLCGMLGWRLSLLCHGTGPRGFYSQTRFQSPCWRRVGTTRRYLVAMVLLRAHLSFLKVTSFHASALSSPWVANVWQVGPSCNTLSHMFFVNWSIGKSGSVVCFCLCNSQVPVSLKDRGKSFLPQQWSHWFFIGC